MVSELAVMIYSSLGYAHEKTHYLPVYIRLGAVNRTN